MKYFKSLLLALAVFNPLISVGQQDPVLLKQVEAMKQITYGFGKVLFEDSRMFYKTRAIEVLPWKTIPDYSEKEVTSIADTLISNVTLKTETGEYSGSHLILETRFPVNLTDVDKVLRLSILESHLTDSLGHNLELHKTPSTFYGSEFSSGYRNGEGYSYNWQNLNASFPFKSEVEGTAKGSVLLRAEFISEYDYVRITSKDIGKEFTFGGSKFKIINIIDNRLVISGLDEELDFEFINLNDNNKEIALLSVMEMLELKKSDSTISVLSSGTSQGEISKTLYDLLIQNPELTLDEYGAVVHDAFVKILQTKDKEQAEKYFGPTYTVIQTAGPIENLYLYYPVMGSSRDFEVKL